MNTLKKLLHYIGAYRLLLVLSVVLAVITSLLVLWIPLRFGDAIDLIDGASTDFGALKTLLVRILVLIVLYGIFMWIMGLVNNRLSYRVTEDLRNRAIEKLQHLPLSWVDQRSVGDLTDRIIADCDQLSDGLLLGFAKLFSGLVTIIATLIFMFSKSVLITLLVILLTPLSFFVAKFIASHSHEMFIKQTSTRGEETGLVDEMIGGLDVVQAFSYEKRADARFNEVDERLKNYSFRAMFYSSLTNPSTRAVNSVIYAAVALVGALHIVQGRLSVGGLTVLLSYANQYMKPFNDISSVVTELQNAMACAERLFDMIETEPESADGTVELKEAEGKVDADRVFFSYVPERPLIRNYEVHAKPGERVAIVGPTGCGKTTFINLLMRFYDIDSGSILIDGTSLYDITRHSLRDHFGMVLQETWLKEGTVRENLLFARCDASEEEMVEACKKAHSWSFIRRLPEGLDTKLSGSSLSEGQKQLLCITRVMLKDPDVLILDEATSSIDTRTEVEVQKAFDELMKGRTSFVVAHRLSTIRNADQIIVMKDGEIIEKGTHDSLLRANGFYAELYRSQFEAA